MVVSAQYSLNVNVTGLVMLALASTSGNIAIKNKKTVNSFFITIIIWVLTTKINYCFRLLENVYLKFLKVLQHYDYKHLTLFYLYLFFFL